MANKDDQHALIDTYLKKSRWSKVRAFLYKLTFSVLCLWIIGYLIWRAAPEPRQTEWRHQSKTLNTVVSYLEGKGLLPSPIQKTATVQSSAASKRRQTEAPSKNSRPLTRPDRPTSPEQPPTDQVFDFRDPKLLELARADPDGKPKDSGLGDADAPREKVSPFDQQKAMRSAAFSHREAERERREKVTRGFLTEAGLSISWKAWDQHNPVTWDDFKNQNIDEEITKWGAYISTNLATGYNGRAWFAFAYMVPESSWVRPGVKYESTLRHERLHFDITELFARKLRLEIARNHESKIREIINQVHTDLSNFQIAYDNETSGDHANQARWEEKIATALEETANFTWIPKPQRLARQKYVPGYFLLAQTYDHGGPGFERSERLALKWYNLGIQKKDTDAMNNLAALTLKGVAGKPPNPKKAFRMYIRAARQGNAYAQFNAGVMYWRGLGVEPNREKAVDLFIQSADHAPYARKALKILESEQ